MWPLVQADLQETFHVCEPAAQNLPWPWLRNLIMQIVATPGTRTHSALHVNT